MSVILFRSLLLCSIAAGVVWAPASWAERGSLPVPSAQPSAADTLRFEVVAGDPLIVALPGRVDGTEVSYRVDEAPALSWLVDRSFYYRTMAGERGTLAVRLRRSGPGAEVPVVLLITITA